MVAFALNSLSLCTKSTAFQKHTRSSAQVCTARVARVKICVFAVYNNNLRNYNPSSSCVPCSCAQRPQARRAQPPSPRTILAVSPSAATL